MKNYLIAVGVVVGFYFFITKYYNPKIVDKGFVPTSEVIAF